MLTQTEARPAAGDVLKNWPIETSDQRPSPHVSAEEFREALSRVALDCRVADIREVGTHSVIFAEVLSTVHATDGQPLIYHSRNYATIRHVA